MRVAACLVIVLCGCSMIIVNGPPAGRSPTDPIVCTVSAAAPVAVDVIAGAILSLGLGTLAYGYGVASGADESGIDGSDAVLIVFGALSGVPWFISAGVGQARARSCREAKATANLR